MIRVIGRVMHKAVTHAISFSKRREEAGALTMLHPVMVVIPLALLVSL